jgi:hypothetical protein
MRRCMTFKRYNRYGTTKAIWQQIEAGTVADKLARRALIASGPQPASEVIAP